MAEDWNPAEILEDPHAEAPEPADERLEGLLDDPADEAMTFAEEILLEDLSFALQEAVFSKYEEPAAPPPARPRREGESAAAHQLAEMKAAFDQTCPPPAAGEEPSDARWLASHDAARYINCDLQAEPMSFKEAPHWLKIARAEIHAYLLRMPEQEDPREPMRIATRAAEYGLNKEYQQEPNEYPAASTHRGEMLLEQLQEKLAAFHADPAAQLVLQHRNDFRQETFTARDGRPETLLLKALDIVNHEISFQDPPERREFAELAANFLTNETLGQYGGTALLRAEKGGPEYAAAENQFRQLLKEQLEGYQEQGTDHLPQHFQLIHQRLARQLQEPLEHNGELYAGIARHRLLLSRQEIPDPALRFLPDADPPAEFAMARYETPPPEDWRREEFDQAREQWLPEDTTIISRLLQALTEQYPGTAAHPGELTKWRPEDALADLKAVFDNQKFLSREEKRAAAASLGSAAFPPEEYAGGAVGPALAKFLLEPSNMYPKHYRERLRRAINPNRAANPAAAAAASG